MNGHLQERLTPCLLDRLSKYRSEKRGAGFVSLEEYEDGIIQYLEWLLNTVAPGAKTQLQEVGPWEVATSEEGQIKSSERCLGDFERVWNSVIAFGIPDFSSAVFENFDDDKLAEALAEAIRRFEPRIIPETLKVQPLTENEIKALAKGEAGEFSLNLKWLVIEAELRLPHQRDSLRITTAIDVTSSRCRLTRSRHGA